MCLRCQASHKWRVSGWSADPHGSLWQVSQGNGRGCLWGPGARLQPPGGGDQGYGGGRYDDPEDMDMEGQSVYDCYAGGNDSGNYDNGAEACVSTAAAQEQTF